MTRRASHRDGEVPAVIRRARILHEVLDLLRTEGARRLETERRHAVRQRQVVVDGLRHMHDIDRAPHLARIVGDGCRAVRRIVPADGHEMRDAEFRERLYHRTQIRFLLRRIEAAHLEDAAARQMNAADILRFEANVVLLAAREAGEAVVDAEHIPAVARRLIRDAGNNAVDARRRAAAADNGNDVLDSNHEESPFAG